MQRKSSQAGAKRLRFADGFREIKIEVVVLKARDLIMASGERGTIIRADFLAGGLIGVTDRMDGPSDEAQPYFRG